MSRRSLLPICLFALAACGDDGGSGTPDAPKQIDAQGSRVMEVTCPATPAATFTTQASSFSPATASVMQGQVVKFVSTTTDHPIGPVPADPTSDPGLVVPGTQTKCFMFLAKGSFKFRCTVHNYAGTLTVN